MCGDFRGAGCAVPRLRDTCSQRQLRCRYNQNTSSLLGLLLRFYHPAHL